MTVFRLPFFRRAILRPVFFRLDIFASYVYFRLTNFSSPNILSDNFFVSTFFRQYAYSSLLIFVLSKFR